MKTISNKTIEWKDLIKILGRSASSMTFTNCLIINVPRELSDESEVEGYLSQFGAGQEITFFECLFQLKKKGKVLN